MESVKIDVFDDDFKFSPLSVIGLCVSQLNTSDNDKLPNMETEESRN
jgi:hypothetical protein